MPAYPKDSINLAKVVFLGMEKLLIGTRNGGKYKEIKPLLAGVPFKIICLEDISGLPPDFEANETGRTFEENAILKARTYGAMADMLTIAEDAGLEIDALNGRPGIRSARYIKGSDTDRYQKILQEMRDVPDDKRGAQFTAVVAIFDPKTKKMQTCRGEYHGIITRKPRGENGFGYDPIFFNVELGKTNAELTVEEKNAVSHRARAFARAREILLREFV